MGGGELSIVFTSFCYRRLYLFKSSFLHKSQGQIFHRTSSIFFLKLVPNLHRAALSIPSLHSLRDAPGNKNTNLSLLKYKEKWRHDVHTSSLTPEVCWTRSVSPPESLGTGYSFNPSLCLLAGSRETFVELNWSLNNETDNWALIPWQWNKQITHTENPCKKIQIKWQWGKN